MTTLPPHIAEKCAKAIGQLSATNEGSVIAGARGLTRILEGAGFAITDLMEHVAAPRETVRLEPPAYPFGRWRRAAGDPASTVNHRARVDHLQNIGGCILSRWESEFLESLRGQLAQGRRLSDRQVEILGKIDAKVRSRP